MTAAEKVYVVQGLALRGYWMAQTPQQERLFWRIVCASAPSGSWLKPE